MNRDYIKVVLGIAVIATLTIFRKDLDGGTIAVLACLGVSALAWLFVGGSEARETRKRSNVLPKTAEELGLKFQPYENPDFLKHWDFLDALRGRVNPVVTNVFSGTYAGQNVFAFDVTSTSGDVRSTYTLLMLVIDGAAFPKLRIFPNQPGAGLVPGINEIQFESSEFSKKFITRAADKKFAYDVCHPKMIEFLLRYPYTLCTIQGPTIILEQEFELPPERYKYALNELVKIRSLLPEYLFPQNT